MYLARRAVLGLLLALLQDLKRNGKTADGVVVDLHKALAMLQDVPSFEKNFHPGPHC